jgi:hypothetical protein
MQIVVINVNIVVVANTLDKENDMTIRILNHQINIIYRYNIIFLKKDLLRSQYIYSNVY